MTGKFSPTDLEEVRDLSDIGPNQLDETDDLSITEYMNVIVHMKNGKATGPDSIPVEVFKNSILTKHELS